jgi:hypothetical protein
VTLSRGQVYYVEALLKEGPGGDHISVGVKLPSGVLQRPIANNDVYIKPPGRAFQLVYLYIIILVVVFCLI